MQNTEKIRTQNEQIITSGKSFKNILKVYQTYMKGVDTSWTGFESNSKLEAIIDIQNKFMSAFTNSNAADLDKQVKTSKDKSLDTVLKIIAQ